jgi:23S rRNA pseudouridine1911/1915/1917 synthase
MSEESEVLDEEQELYEHYRFTVDRGQGLLRIDKFLTQRIEGISRNKLQNAAHANCILVNEKAVKSSYKVKPCDIISIVLPHPQREIELIPQDIPINIVFEDDDIIILNKEAGMVVHPGYGNYTGTLMNALVYHFQHLPKKDDEDLRPGLVHRIDKNTSGIIMVTKNDISQAKIAKQFFDHTISRKYVALAWGDFKEDSGTIEGNLGRSPKDRKIMTVFPDGLSGKPAITHYKVIERLGYTTLIECRLETGRTHQIRAHMKYIGHPLFNDDTYGGNSILKGTTFSKYRQFIDNCFKILPRQALHAKSLGFIHPATGKNIFFDSDLPSDMEQVLTKWRTYISDKKNEFEE